MAGKRIAIATRELVKSTGTVRNTHEQIAFFTSRGHHVDVYGAAMDRAAIGASGATAFAVGGWPWRGIRRRRAFDRRVARAVRRGVYDLVVGHGDILEQDVLCLHNCVHLAHELVHGRPLPADRTMARLHGELLERQRFRLLVANSAVMQDDVVMRFGVPAEHVRVIHPGFDPGQFGVDADRSGVAAVRREMGVSESNEARVLVGLITSGDFEKRNVGLFLEAAAAMPSETRDRCSFVVVGKTKEHRSWNRRAEELGIGRKVTWLDPASNVRDRYRALDVFVLPAKWEEFGRVVLEAMACGAPVITSDRVGSSEILEGESREFIFPSGDRRALAGLLTRTAENPALRERLGRLNRETAKSYTVEKAGEKFGAVLREFDLLP